MSLSKGNVYPQLPTWLYILEDTLINVAKQLLVSRHQFCSTPHKENGVTPPPPPNVYSVVRVSASCPLGLKCGPSLTTLVYVNWGGAK